MQVGSPSPRHGYTFPKNSLLSPERGVTLFFAQNTFWLNPRCEGGWGRGACLSKASSSQAVKSLVYPASLCVSFYARRLQRASTLKGLTPLQPSHSLETRLLLSSERGKLSAFLSLGECRAFGLSFTPPLFATTGALVSAFLGVPKRSKNSRVVTASLLSLLRRYLIILPSHKLLLFAVGLSKTLPTAWAALLSSEDRVFRHPLVKSLVADVHVRVSAATDSLRAEGGLRRVLSSKITAALDDGFASEVEARELVDGLTTFFLQQIKKAPLLSREGRFLCRYSLVWESVFFKSNQPHG